MATEPIDDMLESLAQDAPVFPPALRAAMEHGLGAEDEGPWSNERLGHAMTPNLRTSGINRSTVASWIHPDPEARKAITTKNAVRLFQVMGRQSLSPERFQVLEDLRDAYVADFPDRNPDPIAQIVETCAKISEHSRPEIEQGSSGTDRPDAVTSPNGVAADLGRASGHGRRFETWHILSSIGVLAAVITAVLAATQYFDPSSSTPGITVEADNDSSVNVGNGTQINIGAGATVGASSTLLDDLSPDATGEGETLDEN